MDEKYLKSLYDWIDQADKTFRYDVTFDQFKTKMQDPSYVQKMHSWIGGKDVTFANDIPIDSFVNKIQGITPVAQPVGVKKKSVSIWGRLTQNRYSTSTLLISKMIIFA